MKAVVYEGPRQVNVRATAGQASVKRYDRQLRELIAAGRAKPSFIVSHQIPLERAPEAYQHFDAPDDRWTRVVLKPGVAA
jgi:glutathione-independent formaldehyde dehydrogenase